MLAKFYYQKTIRVLENTNESIKYFPLSLCADFLWGRASLLPKHWYGAEFWLAAEVLDLLLCFP